MRLSVLSAALYGQLHDSSNSSSGINCTSAAVATVIYEYVRPYVHEREKKNCLSFPPSVVDSVFLQIKIFPPGMHMLQLVIVLYRYSSSSSRPDFGHFWKENSGAFT